MSTNLALAGRPARSSLPDTAGRPEERHALVEVTPTRAQRRARPRIVYAFVAVGALGVLLLAQLAISIVLSKGAYQLSSLQAQQTTLSRTQQGLDEQLSVLRSPQNLARNAQALGMVADTTPVYLDPVTGTVYGTPTAAASSADGATSTANQVANSLLDGVGVVAAQGDTATSKEQQASGATATPTGTDATTGTASTGTTTDSGDASASGSGSAGGSVPSDPNQLQAPQTR